MADTYEPRTVAVVHGSDSDLRQMVKGLKYLYNNNGGPISMRGVYRYSVHHNPAETIGLLARLSNENVEFIIAAAGWANHLTGMCDRFLRNMFNNRIINVVGVAFEDEDNTTHTQAAILSITEMPEDSVKFDDYVGEEGFYNAAVLVATGDHSEFPNIEIGDRKKTKDRSIEEAYCEAKQLITIETEE